MREDDEGRNVEVDLYDEEVEMDMLKYSKDISNEKNHDAAAVMKKSSECSYFQVLFHERRLPSRRLTGQHLSLVSRQVSNIHTSLQMSVLI